LFPIRLTAEEHAILKAAAAREGIGTSTYARYVLLWYAQRPFFPQTLEGYRHLLERGGLPSKVQAWVEKMSKQWPLPSRAELQGQCRKLQAKPGNEQLLALINNIIKEMGDVKPTPPPQPLEEERERRIKKRSWQEVIGEYED